MRPGLRMPRIAMHKCCPCTTTITPVAASRLCTASATCAVNRSCNCRRLAYRSTSRATLEKPTTRPCDPGMYPTAALPCHGTRWCSQTE
jgi:hypothetical protein